MMGLDACWSGFLPAAACLLLVAWWAVRAGKMDRTGAAWGVVVGASVWLGAGWPGLVFLAGFFALGVAATAWKARSKRQLGLLEGQGGRRGAANVLSNGGVAAGLGFMTWALPIEASDLTLMLGASLAAATSDTLSSELGNVYGRRFFRITGGPGRRGEDGVISPEGTAIGLAAALVMGFAYSVLFAADWREGLIVAAGGLAGNLCDSWLGATWQRAGYLDNHQVNVLNTLAAALLAGVMARALL